MRHRVYLMVLVSFLMFSITLAYSQGVKPKKAPVQAPPKPEPPAPAQTTETTLVTREELPEQVTLRQGDRIVTINQDATARAIVIDDTPNSSGGLYVDAGELAAYYGIRSSGKVKIFFSVDLPSRPYLGLPAATLMGEAEVPDLPLTVETTGAGWALYKVLDGSRSSLAVYDPQICTAPRGTTSVCLKSLAPGFMPHTPTHGPAR